MDLIAQRCTEERTSKLEDRSVKKSKLKHSEKKIKSGNTKKKKKKKSMIHAYFKKITIQTQSQK